MSLGVLHWLHCSPMLLWWLSRPGWSTYSLVIQFAVLECFSWIYHQGKKETYPLNYMILCPFRKSLLTLWHSNRAFVSTSRRSQRIMNSRTDTQAMANSLLSKSIKMEIKRNWNYPLRELNCCVEAIRSSVRKLWSFDAHLWVLI